MITELATLTCGIIIGFGLSMLAIRSRKHPVLVGMEYYHTRLRVIMRRLRMDFADCLTQDDRLEIAFEVVTTALDQILSGFDGTIRPRLFDVVQNATSQSQCSIDVNYTLSLIESEALMLVKFTYRRDKKKVKESMEHVRSTIANYMNEANKDV